LRVDEGNPEPGGDGVRAYEGTGVSDDCNGEGKQREGGTIGTYGELSPD
jgi:hypothetical protein